MLPNFSVLGSSQAYQPLASDPEGADIAERPDHMIPSKISAGPAYLSTAEKLALIRPLVLRYMLPLCAVYIEEYVINSVGGRRHDQCKTD